MKLHNFKESLARSHRHADAPWWNEVYKGAFRTLQTTVDNRADGVRQRLGIDRLIVLKCGRTFTVDEKVREKNYGDFLLERWSDLARKSPGWIQKPLLCDYIAYAVVPIATCWLFPTIALQGAWKTNGRKWLAEYGTKESFNEGWITENVPVPRAVLLKAITDQLTVRWTA